MLPKHVTTTCRQCCALVRANSVSTWRWGRKHPRDKRQRGAEREIHSSNDDVPLTTARRAHPPRGSSVRVEGAGCRVRGAHEGLGGCGHARVGLEQSQVERGEAGGGRQGGEERAEQRVSPYLAGTKREGGSPASLACPWPANVSSDLAWDLACHASLD